MRANPSPECRLVLGIHSEWNEWNHYFCSRNKRWNYGAGVQPVANFIQSGSCTRSFPEKPRIANHASQLGDAFTSFIQTLQQSILNAAVKFAASTAAANNAVTTAAANKDLPGFLSGIFSAATGFITNLIGPAANTGVVNGLQQAGTLISGLGNLIIVSLIYASPCHEKFADCGCGTSANNTCSL
jgi:hypothetical protein